MKPRAQPRARVEFGDWQTPASVAQDVVGLLARTLPPPASVLEPTCGVGALLCAASERYPHARLLGFDIDAHHLVQARAALAHTNATLTCADFFAVDWDDVVANLPQPILVLGNPPWVTNAAMGALSGANLPLKSNFKHERGIDARTGKGNFDVSEWMLLRLLRALTGKQFVMAMLCKTRVARQVLRHLHNASPSGAHIHPVLYEVDARRHFDATVDAVLLVLQSQDQVNEECPVYESLSAPRPSRMLGFVGGELVNDVASATETSFLAGPSDLVWRSGIKHDCAPVMEWSCKEGVWPNGTGERPGLTDEGHVYPLCKGSSVAAGRAPLHRVLVTQTRVGEDTMALQQTSPHTWAYLQQHAPALEARKSRIYKGQPSFSIFGVGPYSFAPFKVAICGLYKRLTFQVYGPVQGRPVMFDDTCYFLPCTSEAQAVALAHALNGELAQKFWSARVFWDNKRPITKALLGSLSLPRLLAHA